MQFGISVAFEDESVAAGGEEDVLAKALGRILGGQGVTVEGPFILDGAEFVGDATKGVSVGECLLYNILYVINLTRLGH